MCGRIILTHKPKAIPGFQHDLDFEDWQGPRYNVAPTESIATLLNDGTTKVRFTHWGLIPTWAKDPSIGNRMINARAETLAEKPAFKRPFRQQRCIILADGFYEWKAIQGQKRKQPILIRMKSKDVFALAGLWDEWTDSDGTVIKSATIITTEPNSLVKSVHNRMPVILQVDFVESWLSEETHGPDILQLFLVPYPPEEMEMFPVSTMVNRPGVDEPACIEPLRIS